MRRGDEERGGREEFESKTGMEERKIAREINGEKEREISNSHMQCYYPAVSPLPLGTVTLLKQLTPLRSWM